MLLKEHLYLNLNCTKWVKKITFIELSGANEIEDKKKSKKEKKQKKKEKELKNELKSEKRKKEHKEKSHKKRKTD